MRWRLWSPGHVCCGKIAGVVRDLKESIIAHCSLHLDGTPAVVPSSVAIGHASQLALSMQLGNMAAGLGGEKAFLQACQP